MAESTDTQRSGYLEIKQSSKVKGRSRKLKNWQRKWVVVKKMTDMAAGTQSARVDIYINDPSSRTGGSQNRAADRMTFVLDQLTAVQSANSKTHPFAFELVETEPVLVLSGASQEESVEWMTALRQIFFAGDIFSDTDSYKVTIQQNKDSLRSGLSGNYILSISPEGVCLKITSTHTQHAVAQKWQILENPSPRSERSHSSQELDQVNGASRDKSSHRLSKPLHGNSTEKIDGEMEEEEEEVEVLEVLTWRLSMLKRFDMDKNTAGGQKPIFVLECGPNSPTGEATFRFFTENAFGILASIRKSISIAMEKRKNAGHTAPHNSDRSRSRTVSTVVGYQTLLERSGRAFHADGILNDTRHARPNSRSGSSSSGSTMTPVAPPSEVGELGTEQAKNGREEKGLPIRHRISTVSVPSGFFSSSPASSDAVFGPELPQLPHQTQELHAQQYQMQQVALWQQQQQQQQANKVLFCKQMSSPIGMSPQLPLLQQPPVSPLSQQPPPPPTSAPSSTSPSPTLLLPQGHPQQMVPLDEHQQQLQLWIQQQQLHRPEEVDEWPEDRGGMAKNSSVPNVSCLTGECKAFDNDVFSRMRTSSMTTEGNPGTSGSVCSADSGVVVIDPRKGSNSFGSNSTESSVSARKTNTDGVGPVPESLTTDAMDCPSAVPPRTPPVPMPPPRHDVTDLEDKATPQDGSLHIYQDLDSVKFEGSRRCSRRGSSTYDMGRRRHSTGEMSHNHDYEELEAVKRTMVSMAASEADTKDQPPELPARPSFFQKGKGNFSSALGMWQGFRSLSMKDRKKDTDSDETLTSSRVKEGMMSRSNSTDLYSTICDDEPRPHRRSSSDVNPVSSYPDLRFAEDGLLTFRRKLAEPGLSSSTDTTAGGFFNADKMGRKKSATQSLNLLSFSECDVSQTGGGHTSLPGDRLGQRISPATVNTRAALLDFFLDDASFHSNPMVTGDFQTSQASSISTVSNPPPQNQSPFPEPTQPVTAEGWADFTGQGQATGLQVPGDLWAEEFSWTPAVQPGDAGTGAGWGTTESVYIDMRTRGQGEDDTDTACDYVAPGGLSKNQALLEFLVYQ